MAKNFKYLDDLIHSGAKEIFLDSDIILEDSEESNYKNGIKLNVDNLVIYGNGHSIDAKGKTRIFKVPSNNITIKKIVLKNGLTLDNGGAIHNSGKLTITESTITGNTAKGSDWKYGGGAIYNSGKLTITESTITENTSQKNGGAIYNNDGILTITESIISGNTAKSSGGAIYNKSELTITESTIAENTSQKKGGAIFNENCASIYDSNFTDNISSWEGGAIYNDGGEITISKSMFTSNTTKTSIFSFGFGGAIYNFKGTSTISKSTFNKNRSKEGGAIYNDGGEITLSKSMFTSNTAKKYGGAIKIYSGTIVAYDSCFEDNFSRMGGAIHNSTNTRKNRGNSILKSNIEFHRCDFYNNSSNSFGGAIWSNYYTKFYNCNFNDNISKKEGNIIYFDAIIDTPLIIENSYIRNNFAQKSDIYINNLSFTSIINTKISNVSDNYVIHNNKGILSILNLKFEHENKPAIYNNNVLYIKESNIEKIIKSTPKSVIKYKNEINNSNAGFQYLEELINENSEYIALNRDIIMNDIEQAYYEGGIELNQDNLILDGQNHTIDANELSRVFIITGNNITIKNIKFKNGFYFKNELDGFNEGGGVIYSLHNTSVTIKNCEFSNNISRNIAGCINNKGIMNVFDTKFNNNFAQNLCGTIANFNSLNLDSCNFEKNFAPNFFHKKNNYDETAGNIFNNGNITYNKCEFNKSKFYYILISFSIALSYINMISMVFLVGLIIAGLIVIGLYFLIITLLSLSINTMDLFGLKLYIAFTILCFIVAIISYLIDRVIIRRYAKKVGFDYYDFDI